MTNGTYSDTLQAEAAGMAEGYITSDVIHMHYQNTLAEYCTNEKDYCTKLSKFLSDNKAWIDKQMQAAKRSELSYWHQVYKFFIYFFNLELFAPLLFKAFLKLEFCNERTP